MYQKQRTLAVKNQKLAMAYAIEYKILSFLSAGRGGKKIPPPKMGYEARMFMKTKIQKMSDLGFSTMLMKTR
jgi:hypothetical protein